MVLTFDDSAKTHFTVARPILKKYGFGATFFITEGFDFLKNKEDYMTWDQIAQLHRAGFEIGNHTRDHLGITDANVGELAEQLAGINRQCEKHGIPPTVTFVWPGNAVSTQAFAVLQEHGIKFARRGGGGGPEYPYQERRGFGYEPGLDHPLLIPSAGDARPDWQLEDFIRAVQQATCGRIAVLQFHGVPDITAWEPCVRPWTNSACPCMHSDPQFPDCKPSETQRLVGWLSFYEGRDIQTELKRIEDSGWNRSLLN